jgi:hypothetical protein
VLLPPEIAAALAAMREGAVAEARVFPITAYQLHCEGHGAACRHQYRALRAISSATPREPRNR